MTEAQPTPVAWLAVVCTGKGTHKRTRLCDVRWHPDYPGGQWNVTDAGFPNHEDEDVQNSWEVFHPKDNPAAWVYVFHCRRCGRNPRIGRDKWAHLMEALHPKTWPEGVSSRDLDLSLLPF